MLSKVFKLILQVYSKASQNHSAQNSPKFISGTTILKGRQVLHLSCEIWGGKGRNATLQMHYLSTIILHQL